MKFMISFQCDTVEEARAVVDAVAAIGKEPTKTSRVIDDVEKVLAVSDDDSKPAARPNINPGESKMKRLSGQAYNFVIVQLGLGKQPEGYAEHLKLLWTRGEVKFDGSNWYI